MAARQKTATETLPCQLCKHDLERRTDKKGKPYFVCDECGTQLFIRYRAGISRLEKIMAAPAANPEPFKLTAYGASGITRQLELIDDAVELWEEADQFFDPDTQDTASGLALDDWVKQRTTRIRSILNLK